MGRRSGLEGLEGGVGVFAIGGFAIDLSMRSLLTLLDAIGK
jgi:hypothetical protein